MTAPTAHLDAARLLGVPAGEIASVEQLDDGVRLVAMASGRNVVYRIEPDGTVMFQHKPDPERHYTLPVYEPPEDAVELVDESAGSDDDEDVPTGSIAEVLAWVHGGDGGDEPTEGWEARAQAALDAERAKDKPRAGLVDRLEAVLPEESAGSDDDVEEEEGEDDED